MIGIWAAPSTWAGYLVNNVKDNLTEEEIEEIRAARKNERVINVLGTGEDGEYTGVWDGKICMMHNYEVERVDLPKSMCFSPAELLDTVLKDYAKNPCRATRAAVDQVIAALIQDAAAERVVHLLKRTVRKAKQQQTAAGSRLAELQVLYGDDEDEEDDK